MKNSEFVQAQPKTSHIIAQSTVVISLAFLLPFMVHLIPFSGEIPLGARFLPIFYAPLLAAFWNLRTAGVATIAMPFVNLLTTGNPPSNFALIMTLEVAVFLLLAWKLKTVNKINIITGPLSYLGAKVVSSIILGITLFLGYTQIAPLDFALNSILNGIPGIIVMFIISYFLVANQTKPSVSRPTD